MQPNIQLYTWLARECKCVQQTDIQGEATAARERGESKGDGEAYLAIYMSSYRSNLFLYLCTTHIYGESASAAEISVSTG